MIDPCLCHWPVYVQVAVNIMESEEQVQLNSPQNLFVSIAIFYYFLLLLSEALLYAEKDEIQGSIQVKQLT